MTLRKVGMFGRFKRLMRFLGLSGQEIVGLRSLPQAPQPAGNSLPLRSGRIETRPTGVKHPLYQGSKTARREVLMMRSAKWRQERRIPGVLAS